MRLPVLPVRTVTERDMEGKRKTSEEQEERWKGNPRLQNSLSDFPLSCHPGVQAILPRLQIQPSQYLTLVGPRL